MRKAGKNCRRNRRRNEHGDGTFGVCLERDNEGHEGMHGSIRWTNDFRGVVDD